jgi:FkbM family methyltransferase
MRDDIRQLTEFLQRYNFNPNNFVEIGSRDGHDTEMIRQYWNLSAQNCYIIEAHPQCYRNITNTYPELQTLNIAASDETKVLSFNAGIFGKEHNVGVSSVLERTRDEFISEKIEVDGWRMEDVMEHFSIDKIDFMKVDVEGFALQVLKGFGDKIKHTQFIQVELETVQVWAGQSYYSEVINYLNEIGFEVVDDIDLDGLQRDVLFKNTVKL